MAEKNHLYILWTNGDPVTAEKMVFMYGINSLLQKWWEKVTLIVWGTPTKVAAENPEIQKLIREARDAGVHVTACKACADQLGATEGKSGKDERGGHLLGSAAHEDLERR